MKKQFIKYKRKKLAKSIVIIFLLSVFIIISAFVNYRCVYEYAGIYPKSTDKMSVSFLDVGQADCIYISVENHNILIDCGADIKAEKITQFFNRNNITEIDAIIGTHPDSDHIGGLNYVLNNYKVNSVYFPKIKSKVIGENTFYSDCIKYISENKIPLHYVNKSIVRKDNFESCFTDNLKLDFISPDHEYGDENSDSIMLKLSYGKRSFLFTGDCSAKTEKYLLENNTDLSADVLKVSHHGSRSATSTEFLNAVNPAIAVVSVGENRFNLPNVEIIRKLCNFNCEIYRTDNNGIITLTTDGEKINIHTEK